MEDASGSFMRAFKPLQGNHNNERIAKDLNELCGECILGIEKETRRIASDLNFITDAIACTVVEGWKTVRAVVNELYDENVIHEAISRAPRSSRFHNNRDEAVRLRQCIEHWWSEYLYHPPDSINRAVSALAERKAENISFLQNYKR
jgi:hypothetical protein